MTDALFLGHGGLTGGWACLSGTWEVCNKYYENISDGGLQTHVETYGYQLEED
jgi:hypothetical protein